MKSIRSLTALGIAVFAFALPFTAGATVKKEGSWPGVEKKIDLDFEGKPSEGLTRLAKEAGWSLVVADGVAIDRNGGEVHVAVEDQPADAVLEALFVGRNVVASRNGTLITVTADANAAAAPLVPTPPVVPAVPDAPVRPALPVPISRGEDKSVLGGNLVIHKDEIVHTVTVAGGSLKVEGTVTGDLVVAGGAAKVLNGGRVVGNATVLGGSLKVEKDGRVDGDVGVVGGVLKREEGAIIGGKVVDDEHGGGVKVRIHDGDTTTDVSTTEPRRSGRARLSEAVRSFGSKMTRMSFLFVLGCVLLALIAPRMERLRGEIAARPMRSFAIGMVGTLLGSIGTGILLTVLCITVIGIPVAVLGVLLGALAIYGAIASVLATFGAAVIGHRTPNPYLHLLLGCAAFLVLSSIPWIGPIVIGVVSMIAIGALVATRAGGLLDRRRNMPTGMV